VVLAESRDVVSMLRRVPRAVAEQVQLTGDSTPPLESALARAALLTPGLLAITVFLVWGAADTGYGPTARYPGSLVFLGLVAVTVIASPRSIGTLSRASLLAGALFAAFVCWSFISIVWADVKGDAWDGANRSLLYLLVFVFFSLWPWRSGDAAALFSVYALAITGIGLWFFISATQSDEPAGFFIDGRFSEPSGYPNANCALFLGAFWLALFLASRRETPPFLRPPLLAAGGVLAELALLAQSRGSLIAFPIVAVLYLALVPGRLRSAIFLAAVVGAVFLARHRLLEVFTVVEQDGQAELDRARTAVANSAAGLLAFGVVAVLFDRRVALSQGTSRRIARIAAVGAALLAVATCVFALARYGSPVPRAKSAWTEFKSEGRFTPGSHFSGGLGSNRYDFWRVALGEFRDAPLVGMGADNFAVPYVEKRRSGEEPLYPHSLEIMVLAETGLVGALLFCAFLVSAAGAALYAALRSRGFDRALVVAAVIAFSYWFVHGSGEWFWELPALAGPALAWLGFAVGFGRGPAQIGEPVRSVHLRVAFVGAALFSAASFALPWLAARNVEQAASGWRTNPAKAFVQLDRARGLNPLSDRPDLIAGVIASRIGDLPRMREAFERVLDRNPKNWYAYFELAIVSSLEKDRARALELLAQARALNPSEPVIALVTRKVGAGERISLRVIDRIFLQRLEERTS
jgi:hypothetical protein